MEIIDYFKPGLVSLLVCMLFPIIYIPLHFKFWYNIKRQKFVDFLLIALVLFLIAIVIWKAAEVYQYSSDHHETYFTLLHLVPLLNCILIIYFKDPLVKYLVRQNYEQTAGQSEQYSDQSKLDIAPSNQQIGDIGWDDLIIPADIQAEIMSVIELLRDPKISAKYGVKVPKGILLSGPPGTGKTTIAKVIAKTAGLYFFSFSADQIISKWVGESEKNLSNLFASAEKYKPAIIFIDEIDSIGRERSSDGQAWSENLLNHFLQLIDGVTESEGIYIIGATNRPDLIDSALKRSGRLNKEIEIPIPDYLARVHLFQLYLKKLHLSACVDVNALARITEGMTAADISGICNQAGINSFRRETYAGKREFLVNQEDLKSALVHYLEKEKK